MPVPFTEVTKGLDDLLTYLDGKSEKWLKSLYRGDFETRKYVNMRQFKNWMSQYLIPKIGQNSEDIKILVQNPVKSACEAGYDGFNMNGKCLPNCMTGYEMKDKGYFGKVMAVTPKIIQDVNDKMMPIWEQAGYLGAYSAELRITEGGKAHYIDPTCRVASPPGEAMTAGLLNYSEVVDSIANEEEPVMKWKAEYCAELILTSDWYDKHELCVEFPKEYEDNIKLKMHTKRGGAYYCIPNGNGGFFGAVVAWDNDPKKAQEKVKAIAKEIICDELEVDGTVFAGCDEAIEAGEKFGIDFSAKGLQ